MMRATVADGLTNSIRRKLTHSLTPLLAFLYCIYIYISCLIILNLRLAMYAQIHNEGAEGLELMVDTFSRWIEAHPPSVV
jgi:hypothetical protein